MSLSTLKQEINFKPNYDNSWNIILHEDHNLSAAYVVDVLMLVFGYGYDIADSIMQEAYRYNKAIAHTTDYRNAIIYRNQLEEKELTITLEEVR